MVDKVRVRSKRISAYLIDILFVFLAISLINGIKFINPTYDKYLETSKKYTEILNNVNEIDINDKEFISEYNKLYYEICKYGISYNVVSILVIILYFGIFQKYNNGQTLGKKIMKIKIINNNTEENVSLGKYFIRILPMYFVYVGSVISIFINTILIKFLNYNNYLDTTLIVSYLFLGMAIISFIMQCIRKDERGLQDILAGTKVTFVEN